MRSAAKFLAIVLLVLVILGIAAAAYVRGTGLTARAEPGPLETRLARAVRSFAIPREARQRRNPVPSSAEAVEDGMAHFADHCAICHANDGSGNTDFGRGMFPKPPDLRAAQTQNLTDGELFYIIQNGVRFSGMPAFGADTENGGDDNWRLVRFIRELPRLAPEQLRRMEALNPRSPEEIRREMSQEGIPKRDGEAPHSAKPHVHGREK